MMDSFDAKSKNGRKGKKMKKNGTKRNLKQEINT